MDKSAPTTMCVFALGNSLAANYGPCLAAERVLPTLAPLLVVPTLSPQQFAIAVKTVRDVLSHVERSRAAGAGAMEGSPRAGSLGGMVPSSGGGTSVMAGGKAMTEAVDSGWMAVTAVGSATGGGALHSTGMPAASAVPAAPDGTDLLAGLTLQQSSVAASASQRPLAPPVGTSSSGGSSSSGYGLAGRQVGSGKPMSSLVAVSATALPQPNWAFGGTSTSSGMSPTRPAQTSSWADPFAGLQGGSTGSAQRPAAIPQHVQQQVFDPFALGSVALANSSGGKGQLPAKAQPQAAMQPPAGSFAAGADGSLI